MSVVLSEHLPLLASAPDGVQKLRGLILDLAVRGKLVPQVPNDEPASELLKRIAQEKDRLSREEGLRTTAEPNVSADDNYMQLPDGWSFERLGNLAKFIDYRGRTPEKIQTGVPLITAKNVRFGFISREPCEYVSEMEYAEWMTRGFPRIGDILYTTEAPLGNVALVDIHEKFALAQRVICFQFHEPQISLFLRVGLMSELVRQQIGAEATGMTATGIKAARLKEIPVPIPPLAEQHRIVAKVDELMALCDRLEAEQVDAASAHARLVETLLGTLTQSTDAADLAANWQRLAEHFDTLFTAEASIDALKQTVLQLAVMGKLVPQDRNDESASRLLDRVRAEKAQTPSINKGKRNSSLTVVSNDQIIFELPPGWEWTQLRQLAISGPSNGYSPKPCPYETPYRCLTLSATTQGYFKPDCFKFVDITEATAHQFSLVKGDLLIQRGNSLEYVGMAALYDQENGQFIYPDLMMRIQLTEHVNARFLHSWLVSAFGRSYFMRSATGTQGTMPKVNQGTVARTPIPVPPLAEQHRIVAKVDELMALCNRLKADLATARQHQATLADTLIDAALEAA